MRAAGCTSAGSSGGGGIAVAAHQDREKHQQEPESHDIDSRSSQKSGEGSCQLSQAAFQ